MRTDSGQSCIRGLRHNRVTIDTAKLISPPQSGQVKLLGSGFSYTAKSDFEGQDSFTIQVSGMSNGMRGSSDIRIIVSVGPNVSPQTSPTERRDRPPGDLSSAGQPNQNPTAQGTDQTRQVRLADADASMDPSTRPARILPSQQDTGPSQQGTGTNPTIGVAQVRPALVLPLQRDIVLNQTVFPLQQSTGTNPTIGVAQVRPALVLPLQRDIVLNQTVFPLQQSTGANPTIGVPQVRPVLLLPQGTVQNALPLPLQQGTGTKQTIGVGQVRPANAGPAMRAQGVIGKRF